MNYLLKWGNILLILLTFLSYLSSVVSPASFWPLSFFALIYPWLLLANLLFIALWLVLKKRYFLFSLACIILGWGHLTSFVGMHFFNPAKGTDQAVVVMTFNVHGLKNRKNHDQWLEAEHLANFLNVNSVNILCFQEFPYRKPYADQYSDYIKENSRLRYVYQDGGALRFFSSFPIVQKSTEYFANRSNGYQIVDLDIKGVRVRLYNVHLQSNALSSIADKVASEGNLQEKETWLDIKGMMGRFRRSAIMRAVQAEELAAHIAQSPYPVILCGDLNDVPQSYAYHALSRHLKDAFKQKGSGLGITYAGNIPALRIDYILTSPEFEILHHEISKAGFSDHNPVRVELKTITKSPHNLPTDF